MKYKNLCINNDIEGWGKKKEENSFSTDKQKGS